MTIKLFLKLLIFTAVLLQIIYSLTLLISAKTYHLVPSVNAVTSPYVLCDKQDGFYSLKPDSLDVVFVGSSCIHGNINPNAIWNEYGFCSYDYSSDQQELGTTYYYLKQVFETQSPKVAVIDIYLDGSEKSINPVQAHYSFDHMKNDLVKAEAMWNRTRDDILEIAFPIITYHERWKELDGLDYGYRPNRYNYLKGSFIFMGHFFEGIPEIPENIPVEPLSERTRFWLDSIRELCRKNDCELVLIKTPFTFYNDHFSYYAAIEEYCEEYGIPFLFMNKMTGEIGIDFLTDYADNVHLNWQGQQKLSLFLGKYLQDRYQLPDRKGDPELVRWDEDYNNMMYYINHFWELYEE